MWFRPFLVPACLLPLAGRAQQLPLPPPPALSLTVVDSACQGLPGAVVLVLGTHLAVATDPNGAARLTNLPDSLLRAAELTLQVQCWRFFSQQLRLRGPFTHHIGEVALELNRPAWRDYQREQRQLQRYLPPCGNVRGEEQPVPDLDPPTLPKATRPAVRKSAKPSRAPHRPAHRP